MQSSPLSEPGEEALTHNPEEEREQRVQQTMLLVSQIQTIRTQLQARDMRVSSAALAGEESGESAAVLEARLVALAENLCREIHNALGPIAPDGAFSIAIVRTLREVRSSLWSAEALATVDALLAEQESKTIRRAA